MILFFRGGYGSWLLFPCLVQLINMDIFCPKCGQLSIVFEWFDLLVMGLKLLPPSNRSDTECWECYFIENPPVEYEERE
jgi:hypothetical protein